MSSQTEVVPFGETAGVPSGRHGGHEAQRLLPDRPLHVLRQTHATTLPPRAGDRAAGQQAPAPGHRPGKPDQLQRNDLAGGH